MMRNAFPRFFHKLSRFEKPTSAAKCTKSTARPCQKRQYHKGRDCRDLPLHRRSFFDDLLHERPGGFGWPGRLMADNFRNMQRLMEEMAPPAAFGRFPWGWYPGEFMRPTANRGASGGVQVKLNEQVFEVKVDVHEYSPEELNVRVAGDKLSISGKHQESPDEHGIVSREFSRQFLIPEEVQADSIESMLTNDGYLVISGKVKGSENIEQRNIKIEREPPKPEGEEGEGEVKSEDSGKDK